MTYTYNDYMITDDTAKMDLESIAELLGNSYWAEHRSLKTISNSIEHSTCFGIFWKDKQVGFARVVSDFSTMYWLCDVLIHDDHKGIGLGKKLIDIIVNDDRFINLTGILATRDAHGLYEKYGFVTENEKFMRKQRK